MSGIPYAPHPWDQIAPPPPIAESYDAAERRAEAADAASRVERLLSQAESADERAADLENEADEERAEAESFRDEAEGIIEDEIAPIDAYTAALLTGRLGR